MTLNRLSQIGIGLTCLVATSCFAQDDRPTETDDSSSVSYLSFIDFDFSNVFQQNQYINSSVAFAQSSYNSVYQSLADYSHRIELLPAATSSYYRSDAALYEYMAVPIIAVPGDIRLEVFGQAYDPDYYLLSNIDKDNVYRNYLPNGVMDWNQAEMAVGFGTSLALEDGVNFRTVYTTGTIPGLGDSNVAMSLEFDF
ncbi:hypothetical protein [Echinimonas agarilytica]|uniref:Uncharacterized protein n=1 Tax=Echinimonas agarilytica TaxID=1215918 RepID=A0AA41W7A2_9GAMM|nr:hypothetical protein [Echinimonas agarilytica]MCM2679981.1 hypothetical protein [Echinimonas agarilytica]